MLPPRALKGRGAVSTGGSRRVGASGHVRTAAVVRSDAPFPVGEPQTPTNRRFNTSSASP